MASDDIDRLASLMKKSTARLLVVLLFAMLTISGITFSLYLIYFGAHTTYTYAVALTFLVLSALSGFFNTFTAYSYYRSAFYDEYITRISSQVKPLKTFPTVAIAMPVFNEKTDMVEKNLLRLKEMNYPKDKFRIYLLDDSTKQETRKELSEFAKRNEIVYMHRTDRRGFKAGALNNMLKRSKEEFVAIFDYDEYVTNTNFLTDTLPYFQNLDISYLQTEKRYFKGTFFSDTVDLFDAFFFKFIQPSRALNNTAIFAGSCGIIRRSSIDAIGGFPEYIIEDTFFSYESDLHSFKSIYLPKVYAYGTPILTFTGLVKQQWRYNYGDTQFLLYFLRRSRDKGVRKQSLMSNIDYITHGFGLNYVSLLLILFTIVSIFVIFGAKSPSSVTITQLIQAQYITTTIEILGISSFLISIVAPVVLTKMHFKSLRKGFMVFMLNFSLSFVRTKAAIAASLGMYPSGGWSKGDNHSKGDSKTIRVLRRTFSETAFSSILFVLGAFAFVLNNVYGAVWLIWYAGLYLSTFIFFYKYG